MTLTIAAKEIQSKGIKVVEGVGLVASGLQTRLAAVFAEEVGDFGDRVTQTGPELSLVWTGLLFAQCRRVSQCWDVGRA